MALQKWTLKATAQHQNQRLDDVLVGWLPSVLKQPCSKGKVRKLIVAGAVYLNGKRVKIASKQIRDQAQIQVFIDLKKFNADSTQADRPFEMTQDRVIFEDEHLIVINKPPGLPTQPTLDESRDNLFVAAKKFLAQREGKALDQIYLGLHHRLDRDTSGLILMTKTKDANPGVAELFKSHQINKIYQALTVSRTPVPPAEWTVKNYLGRSKGSGKECVLLGSIGGDFAHTEFRLIEDLEEGLWIEARPQTGRTHQIRVHLSEDQMAILGDGTYSGVSGRQLERFRIPRLMLHAVSLTFIHPILKNRISVQCDLPGDFKQCLNALRQIG